MDTGTNQEAAAPGQPGQGEPASLQRARVRWEVNQTHPCFLPGSCHVGTLEKG